MVTFVRGLVRALAAGLGIFNAFCITVLIGCFAIFLSRSAPSPFYGPSTTEWWTYAADGKSKIDRPVLLYAQPGRVLPVGRTLCLRRMVYVHIYKELDGVTVAGAFDGKTWPLQDPGGGDRVLSQGCQDRISPSLLPPPGPSAPAPGDYVLNVFFVVPRNPFIDLISNGPLIVKLHPVNVKVNQP